MNRGEIWLATLAVASIGACGGKKTTQPAIQTVPVTRRDIVVTAQATGTVEPVDTVAVKSQASGLIVAMPVEIGSQVKPGEVIAQIDTRNLTNDYQRAAAVQQAAEATINVDNAALSRANSLFAQKVITATEHEAAVVAAADAQSALTAAQTNLKTAQQNLEYATVRAEVGGTVISKSASVGSVATSATSTFGGGSTLITIANLQRVRMRALVNETDIGNVHAGMPVSVTIDAFPNRQFAGQVEKVEPQALIQQSVTMFPVLVSLANLDQALLPGMNGEVSIVTEQRQNVLAVANDAVRSARDLPAAAAALGLNPDSMRSMLQASRRSSGRGATSGATTGAGGPAAGGLNSGAQVVFVKQGRSWAPHSVRLGVSDFDYSEVLSGLKEGDQVALLGAAVLQAQRDQATNRVRAITGSGLPGTGATRGAAAGARGGAAGGRRGGP